MTVYWMETRLPLIVVDLVQDADLVLLVCDGTIVVKAHVRLVNVLVSVAHPADSVNCIVMFRSSSYML